MSATNRKCKVLIVGGGPGGYVAAIRAGQLGLKPILVEADRAGGTCLIRGCIPSKAVIHAAERFEQLRQHASDSAPMGIKLSVAPTLDMKGLLSWKNGIVDRLNKGVEVLVKAAGGEIVKGWANFEDAKTCNVNTSEGPVRIEAENVILATGSISAAIPAFPIGGPVLSSTEALDLDDLPNRVVIIGAGYIGLELGIALRKLGSQVTVIEALDRILPLFDEEMSRPVSIWMKKHNVEVFLGSKAVGVEERMVEGKKSSGVKFTDSEGKEQFAPGNRILITVGRKPASKGWGAENMGITLDPRGFVVVNDRCETNMRGVYAVGDLVGEPMLAHKASAQGEMVAEIIAGHKRTFDPAAIPAVCFTDPEIVSVGISPAEAKAAGQDVIVGKFPLAASGRALTMQAGLDGGFVRVVARADNHVILGIQAVGTHVSELSGEFALALEMAARIEDIAGTIHAHPTLSESFPESVLASLGRAIHAAK